MLKATPPVLPYKKNPSSSPLAEDTQHATEVFGGSKFDMILVASNRARDLRNGDMPKVNVNGEHKPTVIALLEIEAGKIGKDYRSTSVKKPRISRNEHYS